MAINSRASLDRSPKKNWVEESGGLPMYIRRIANHLHQEKGMTIGHAISVAVNVVKKMCATGDLNFPGRQDVNAGSHAEACAAVADWERKKAQARVSKGDLGTKWTDDKMIEFLTGEVMSEVIHKGCGCAHEEKKSRRKKKVIAKCDGMGNCDDCKMKKLKKKTVSKLSEAACMTMTEVKPTNRRKKRKIAKRKFTAARREKLQEQGKTDAHGGFPLEKPVDVKNAVRAIGRAKNPDLEKKRIIAAAKKLKCEQYIPDDWTVSKQGFKASEPRDPATGKWWIPGGSGGSAVEIRHMKNGQWAVYVNGKYKKSFKNRGQAVAYVNGMKHGKKPKASKAVEADYKKKQKQIAEQKKKNDAKNGGGSGGSSSGGSSGSKGSSGSGSGSSGGQGSGSGGSPSSGTPNKPLTTQANKKLLGSYLRKNGLSADRVRKLLNGDVKPTTREKKLIADWRKKHLANAAKKKTSQAVKTGSAGMATIPNTEFLQLAKSLDAEINADDPNRIEFTITGPIEKSDADKQLVFGWCSVAKKKDGTVVVDKQGDVLEDIDQMEKVAYDFVLHSRDGGEMHVRKGVSTLVESFVSTPEKWAAMDIPEGTLPVGWWVGFKVTDSEVWKGVKSGKYKMFSVHGSGLRKAMED